jgi:hypothetical protein
MGMSDIAMSQMKSEFDFQLMGMRTERVGVKHRFTLNIASR